MELAEAVRQPVSMAHGVGAVYLSKVVQTDLVKPLTQVLKVTDKPPQELSAFTDDLSRQICSAMQNPVATAWLDRIARAKPAGIGLILC